MSAGGRRTPSITAGVWVLFAVAALIVLSVIATLYWSLHRVERAAGEIRQAETIERELRQLGEDLLDAETGQRGYLLTQNADYLQPYLAGSRSAAARLANLPQLSVQPASRQNIARVVPIVQAKLAELAQTVSLNQGGRRAEALAIVNGGEGKRLMDAFRQLRTDTIDIELRALQANRAALFKELNYAFLTGVVGGGLAVVALLGTALHTTRRLARPIAALIDGIHQMGKDEVSTRVQVTTQDEIGRIAVAFNHMADQIQAAQRNRASALAELERSNAELDRFAYVASHDLKAPLRGIRNLAQWIEEDVAPTASRETLDNLRLLNGRVDRLDKLLESMLAYSRIGRDRGSAETLDTAALVAEIGDYLAPPAGFSVGCKAGMPTLFTPRAPLETVLRNLINNAIKHHDLASGRIEVSAIDRGDAVEFRVSDDGPGIAAEFHERVFQMFQTLKPRDQVEGSGMGLAIVKKTVEGMGGHIRIEPTTTERGTVFAFTWPRGAGN